MATPPRPRPVHVEFDTKTGKYLVSRRLPTVDPKGYDTLGEALAAADEAERTPSGDTR